MEHLLLKNRKIIFYFLLVVLFCVFVCFFCFFLHRVNLKESVYAAKPTLTAIEQRFLTFKARATTAFKWGLFLWLVSVNRQKRCALLSERQLVHQAVVQLLVYLSSSSSSLWYSLAWPSTTLWRAKRTRKTICVMASYLTIQIITVWFQKVTFCVYNFWYLLMNSFI